MSVKNNCHFIGNLGSDPKITTFQDGSIAAQFSIGISDKGYTRKDGTMVPDHTEWVNILAHGSKATFCRDYIHKGDRIAVEGRLRTRKYEDKDHITRYVTEIYAEDIEIMRSKSGTDDRNTPPPPTQGEYASATTQQPDGQPVQQQNTTQQQQNTAQQQQPPAQPTYSRTAAMQQAAAQGVTPPFGVPPFPNNEDEIPF